MQTASKTYGTRQCANDQCPNTFEVRKVNMIYCSSECCRVVSNARLIARYHAKKKKVGFRACTQCSQKLSRYNANTECYACLRKKENQSRTRLLAELGIEYIDEDAG
jgi:hypothetical protein